MSLLGYRMRVVIESSEVEGDTRSYHLTVHSHKGARLSWKDGEDSGQISGAAGVLSFVTQESFSAQGAALELSPCDLADRFMSLAEPNDHLRIEAAEGAGDWQLLCDGFLSSIDDSHQSSPNAIRVSYRLSSEGLQKLLNQSIYNWQGVLAQGDDVRLTSESQAAYADLAKKAVGLAPQEVIKAMLTVGLINAVKLKAGGKAIQDGTWFNYGTDRDWSSWYGADFPNTCNIINQEWKGTLWSMLQALADHDLHEFFWTYGGPQGSQVPVLVHRPRPFPAAPSEGDGAWNALPVHVVGKDGVPGAPGMARRVSDGGRVNAFYWNPVVYSDASSGLMSFKLTLGWWADKRSIEKYGFAPRPVNTNLIPKTDQNFAEVIAKVVERMAYQEAPLYRMGQGVHNFGCLMLGIRPGHVLEDWSTGTPITGYVVAVSHTWRSSPQGLQVGTSVTVARSIVGVTAKQYPAAARALVDIIHLPYPKGGQQEHPSDVAQQGYQSPQKPRTSKSFAGGTRIPYAESMTAAAARHGVPGWLVAETMRKESAMGTDPSIYKVNPTGDLGVMQINTLPSGALADLVANGYRTPDGRVPTQADLLDDATCIDMGAAYLKRCQGFVDSAGCPKSNPNYWRYVSDCYNRGPSAATSGASAAFTDSGLSSYGLSTDVLSAQSAFGSI